MRCSQEHAKNLVDIFAKMEAEVNRFTESQTEVLFKLGTLDTFNGGQAFAENLKLTTDIVERAEEEFNVFISDTGAVIAKKVSVINVKNVHF